MSAYLKAQSALSTTALFSRAMEGYGAKGREMSNHKELIAAALKGVEDLNLRPDGDGFAFKLSRDMMLEVVRVHLTKAYIREGSHGA